MTATNKWLLISESHGDLNRCTPCREKPEQHATYASHSSPRMLSAHFLWAVPICDNLSLAPAKSKQAPTPGRSLDNQRQTDPTVVLGALILPPMRQPWSRWRVFDPMVTHLLQLTGPISSACDRYVQYLLAGPTHRSLTDIGGGYNLGGAGLPHTTPRPSQPAVSTFPYWPCPVSSLTKFHQINQSVECKYPMASTWSSDHLAIYRSLHICLAIENDLSLVIG
jgi:hypothetical protein